ncbi:class I SAM-dependent methyltransferase [Pelosinus propionicus]|uniref:Methyltransferase domain-containing protein n=1 Tax=Pelosinus propionicus DSM 13327 TaxID=1123291 RepID=A0A1I4HTJ3_9FIRM|nr:class I SAM-dependent methyltransferase [Pelosinus propionicus]SFL45472.1 Methyltransferase domain-containing protein [Pelosinus propionicus DSM 13327]
MEHKYEIFWNCDGHTVIDCQSCGFKHVYPLPNQNEVDKLYKESYHTDIKPFPYDIFTEEQIKETKNQVMMDETYRSIYDKVVELKKDPYQDIVDIGCGNFLLAYFFKSKGWAEYCIEPSKDAAIYLERFGLTVMNRTLEEVDTTQFQNVSFVNLRFVLEHLTDPLEALQKVYQILSPGGIIRICVPNDFSEGHLAYMKHFQERPRWVCLPDHINYFNFDSLNRLLTKVGFNEVYRTTDFPLELLLMGGINYYDSEVQHQKVGPFIANFQGSLMSIDRREILNNFYDSIAKVGFGRTVHMYAIKPL